MEEKVQLNETKEIEKSIDWIKKNSKIFTCRVLVKKLENLSTNPVYYNQYKLRNIKGMNGYDGIDSYNTECQELKDFLEKMKNSPISFNINQHKEGTSVNHIHSSTNKKNTEINYSLYEANYKFYTFAHLKRQFFKYANYK